MPRDTRSRSLSTHSLAAPSRRRGFRLAAEPLERRAMLTVLTVDIADPHANDPGDDRYAQIAEAVDAAVPGDLIKVHTGSYNPFVVATDNLTIRPATLHDDVIVDGDLSAGDENCVEINANQVTIRGLTAENASDVGAAGFGNGFLVTGDHNRLCENTASNNHSNGFKIDSSDGNTLAGNTASGNDGTGFGLGNGQENLLVRNRASENGGSGFVVSGTLYMPEMSSGNQLVWNAASHSGGLAGFSLGKGTDNELIGNTASENAGRGYFIGDVYDTVHGNTASDNTGDGFDVENDANTLVGNVSRNNQNGFNINNYGSPGAIVGHTLIRNTADSNARDGFYVLSQRNTFNANSAIGNQRFGFDIYLGHNTLTANTAENNRFDGFCVGDDYVFLADANTFIRNLAAGNRSGFVLQYSNSNTLIGNDASNNSSHGFDFFGGKDNKLTHNTASGNDADGFHFFGSNARDTLTRNTASDNGENGFFVESSDITLIGNTARHNATVNHNA